MLRGEVFFDEGYQRVLLCVGVDVCVGVVCDVLLFVGERTAQEDHRDVAQGVPCAEYLHEGQRTSVVKGDIREHDGGARLVGQDQGMAYTMSGQRVIARLSDASMARAEPVWL